MKTYRSILMSTLLGLTVPATSLATGAASDRLVFEVLLDDEPIGQHSFSIRDSGSERSVESSARFDVRLLFIPVFSYRHTNREVWQDGCLKQLTSETDSNGERYAVELERAGDGYRVTTGAGKEVHQDRCMMSFAYWDKRFLQQDRLINNQTGEVMAVEVLPLGDSRLDVSGRQVPVEGWRILARSEGTDISVFYDKGDGRWLSLETLLEGGRTMRYVPAADQLAAAGRGN